MTACSGHRCMCAKGRHTNKGVHIQRGTKKSVASLCVHLGTRPISVIDGWKLRKIFF